MSKRLKQITPKLPRWEPTPNPDDITVPGLDTAAPLNDQIEQIEQLITIKLQVCNFSRTSYSTRMMILMKNVDANFSKIQQIMSNKILPAVKRYAVATEPVREAAKVRI